jgi:hypothetical protein
VGLLLTALLQSVEGFSVHLYEKRPEYKRTRMVQLASYLVADSLESYRSDHIDGENVEAVFDPPELEEGLAFRQSIPPDLMSLLQKWAQGFVPLNAIERALSNLIDTRASHPVERIAAVMTPEAAMALLAPGDTLIDCTGSRSLLRDHLVPGSSAATEEANTVNIRLEYAIVITFLYGQAYDCNEFCKYYKNEGNLQYKFIPAVHRTCYDNGVTHVTGIVNITAEDYAAMPSQFDGQWLRTNFPTVAASMDRFIDKIKQETQGELVGEPRDHRIPLNLYRARNATSRQWRKAGPGRPSIRQLTGVSGRGCGHRLPVFSVDLAGVRVRHVPGRPDRAAHLSLRDMLDRYEMFMYKQWLRVYMRSKMIKHNKDLLECIDDKFALLSQLHIY